MATSSSPPSTASTSEFDLQRSLSPLDQVTRGTNARSAEHVSKSVRNGNKSLRSKTGCISCRVRRKKCDEIMNEAGACGTCVRLRIKCLGF
ncbi:hypothetical protein DL96DRAFT_5926 [Flagelloscypha sp. PMI_526]|nr:hypothetical protein DL96DRAFT_5926 [Flagelloscypha sp. PMI_526]